MQDATLAFFSNHLCHVYLYMCVRVRVHVWVCAFVVCVRVCVYNPFCFLCSRNRISKSKFRSVVCLPWSVLTAAVF